MVEIANVLADKGLAIHNQRDRVLQICAQREYGTLQPEAMQPLLERNRERGAGSQDRKLQRGHGVVHAARDGPLADQERVGNSCEALQCVVVFVSDRFTGSIRAGHDQNIGSTGCE